MAAFSQASLLLATATAATKLFSGRKLPWYKGLIPVATTSAIAVPYAFVVRKHRPYALSLRGVSQWFVDATWSAPNTVAGALFYAVERLRGNGPDQAKSHHSGSIHLTDQAITGYATTVGIVKAGSNDQVDAHENVHVFQARLLGPFYLPLVAANYALATVFPYWLRSYRRTNPPIRDLRTYFHQGVYHATWHERWAYARAPSSQVATQPAET